MTAPTFEGTPEQQSLAEEIFRIMLGQGAFFADAAPIKQTLSNLADFLAAQQQRDRDTMAREIDAALSANAQVFAREQHDEDIIYVTSRNGTFHPYQEDTSHTFKERLYQPDHPLPVDDISVVVSTSRPALTTVEPVFISDYWQEQAGMVPVDTGDMGSFGPEDEEQQDGQEYTVAAEAAEPQPVQSMPEIAVPEMADTIIPPAPAEVAAFEEAEAPAAEAGPAVPASLPAATEAAEQPAQAPAALPEEVGAEAAEEVPVGLEAAAEAAAAAEEPVAAQAEAETEAEEPASIEADEAEAQAEPEPQAEPAAEEVAAPAAPREAATFALDDDVLVDIAQPMPALLEQHGDNLRHRLIEILDKDPLRRIVRFGNLVYPENDMVNLGKNDLRRIKDDILEAGEPLLDTTIISDLYHNSQRQSDYEGFRFSLNYRLNREKDFEFVGVEGANLWWAKGLPAIGSKRIKAGEMAQMTSYLVEGYDDSFSGEELEIVDQTGVLNHPLTFFEWSNGILVFDAALSTLLPAPVLEDQRSAVLRIESPQHYTSYLAEVRFPTSNRGGWVQGLQDFFQDHLVAGANITLERTEEPHIFTITYEETPGNAERLLTLDEKKNRFGFTDIEYYCSTDTTLLPSQKTFGRLKNLKSLPTNERRKADMVLQHVFEVMGDKVGTRSEPAYQADIETLYVAYNVLRPGSRSFLAALLESNSDYSADGEGFYTYQPEPQPITEEEEEDEDSILAQWDEYDDE